SGNTLAVQLSDLASPPGAYLVADSVRVERVGSFVAAPAIQVFVDGSPVLDGATVDFGSAVVGAPVIKSITVRNGGSADLMLGAITMPAGFSVVPGFGATTLTPGQSTSFAAQMTAATAGSFAGTISFGSNDPDDNPFRIGVRGTATLNASAQAWTIDDGAAGF